jgi:histidinol-phosphatase (PHP family)
MHLLADDEPIAHDAFSRGRIEAYVDAARRAGVGEICFTDHVHRFREARGWFEHPLWQRDATGEIGRYHEAVAAARDEGLPVRAGIEADWFAGRSQAIADTLGLADWDVVLGSVHWVAGLAVDWDAAPVWESHAVAGVWRMYVDSVCEAAASGLYDVMAHPDLAKVFGHRPEPAPEALHAQLADAFAAAGVCAEVSTAGYRRALGEIYPAPGLLAELRRRDVPVTLASDAHVPERVGERFDDALGVLADAGYSTITLFRAREPRQEPLG